MLYQLLKERERHVSISHRHLPTYARHKRFINRRPYQFWYLIQAEKQYVGAIYLTWGNEIGVFINDPYRRRGFGAEAIRLLMFKHPRERFLANINPYNAVSIKFFQKLGFIHLQNTYEHEPN